MTIELKVEQGLVVRPTNPQLYTLIQEPLRKRATRIGVDAAELMRRTGLSKTAIALFAGTGRRNQECGVGITTLAKVVDALNWPVDAVTFHERLSIGGGLLEAAIENAIPQLRAWRNVDAYRDEAGQVRSMRRPDLDTRHGDESRQEAISRQEELNQAAEREAALVAPVPGYTLEEEVAEVRRSAIDEEVERRVELAREQVIKDRVRARLEAEGLI